jgi:hypothetical protein
VRCFVSLFLICALGLACVLALTISPASAQPLETTATVQPTPQVSGQADFTGLVTMAEGQPLPEGLEVVLEGYDMQLGLVWNGRAPLQADGSFSFKAVPLYEGCVYAAYVVYNGVDFTSDQGMLGTESNPIASGDVVNLTFTLSEFSTDASTLQAARLHVILEPVSTGKLQVSLWYVIDNPTAQVVRAAAADQPVLRFSVPQGSTNLQFPETMDTSTLLATADGFGDTASVQPGSNYQMFYIVELSYQDQDEFVLPLHLPVGQAIIMLPSGGLKISGEGLIDNGERTTTDGTNLQVYTTAPMAAESTLRFTFGGPLQVDGLLIGGLAFGAALAAAGGWWFVARRNKRAAEGGVEEGLLSEAQEPAQQMDDLLDSILALDDLYRAGQIEAPAYRQRRAELKERVRLLKEDHAGG